jgi:RsiW-degrading membrane proteinase PrsW (M82 family)
LAVPAVAVVGLSAPIAVVWLALVTLPRSGRATRTDVICGLGCGLIAAGAASLLGLAVDRIIGATEWQRLTLYVPVLEEPLKALAIVVTIGVAAVARGAALPARRCAVAILTVVAAFAASENLDHLSSLLIADRVPLGDWATTMETLRVRAILPPLGHLAESWPVGAAIWLASRRPARRLPILLSGLATAAACHALWNTSALRWWPDLWPLLTIVVVSTGASILCWVAATRWQRRERAAAVAAAVAVPARPRQPAGHR